MQTEVQIVLLVFTLLFLAAVISLALKRIRLPFTVVVLLIGLLLGTLTVSYGPGAPGAHAGEEPHGFMAEFLNALHGVSDISPDLILFILLPTLIFESAFALDARKLLKNLGPILTLAIPALLMSTVIRGPDLRHRPRRRRGALQRTGRPSALELAGGGRKPL
jgi:CPA1 family monovalent cation:H+ antiporter